MRIPIAAAAGSYVAASTALYCFRRAALHKLTAAEVLRRHLTYEPGWPAGFRGRVGFAASFIAWLALFQPIYPLLELGLRMNNLASFFYYYPNANGAGLLVQRISPKEQVLRLDWHRFNVNVGMAGKTAECGLGYEYVSRHPPSMQLNRLHCDFPTMGVRHWPWRQHSAQLLRPALREAARSADVKAAASKTLNAMHRAASGANADAYLRCFASDAVFLGTDPSERWPVEPAFSTYVRERFGKGDGWEYAVKGRHVSFVAGSDERLAYFDEDLENEKLGRCRGTGVLVRELVEQDEAATEEDARRLQWKVQQYSLTMAVPNELALDVAATIRQSSSSSSSST